MMVDKVKGIGWINIENIDLAWSVYRRLGIENVKIGNYQLLKTEKWFAVND